MKRSKNIFNATVAPESLLEQDGSKQYTVGGLSITSNWLANVPREDYRRYIVSTVRLSELERELEEMRDSDQLSPVKQNNVFKISNIKKKIANFDLVPQVKEEQVGTESLMKNEPPDTAGLTLQKVTGLFNSCLNRKCRIDNKQLFIESQKEASQPWIEVPIARYTLQVEARAQPLNNQNFAGFEWLDGLDHRMLLWGEGLKPYCLYGKEEDLNKFQRYLQVETIQRKQLDIFRKLDQQFQQKIINMFGNKVRFFDHNLKVRKAEKEAHMSQLKDIMKMTQDLSFIPRNPVTPNKEAVSQIGQNSDVGQPSEMGQSGVLEQPVTPEPIKEKTQNIASSYLLELSKQSNEKYKDEKSLKADVFKLKVHSSTVFYDEMHQPLNFNDQRGDNFEVQDIKLDLKDEIGMSDVDEESEHYSIESSRFRGSQRVSNKRSSKKGGKRDKVVRMEVENALDEAEKFNINIHQVSVREQQSQHSLSVKSEANLSIMSHPPIPNQQTTILPVQKAYSSAHNEGRMEDFDTSNYLGISRSKTDSNELKLDDFMLDKVRPSEEEEEDSFNSGKSRLGFSNPSSAQNVSSLIQNFKKKKQQEGPMIYENLKEASTHMALQEIKFFMPFNSQTLDFEILQIDMDLEMDKHIVVCARTAGTFHEDASQPRYCHYSVPGGLHFKCSGESDEFVFVLKEPGRRQYIKFWTNPKPKYRRNCSQFLMTSAGSEGFPFACALVMFSSPRPIELYEPLPTITFIEKYLREGESYEFKHQFMDDKRKRSLLQREWNKSIVDSAIKRGDADSFARAVFMGMSDSMFAKLKRGVVQENQRLFPVSDNELRMMEDSISSATVMDLRSFMKVAPLIKFILHAPKNDMLAERIEHLYVYFMHRYGSARNLALVLVREIFAKIDPVLRLTRQEEEVYAIVELYFQVEFEVNELFAEVSKYFRK